ncbi:MAG: LacI family transcriptional regulator [Coriobacteriaceae bacterium]|nr:MAG: LacI family transcriptional regulator [Coriobacteriaceae bacterium]
MGRVSIRDVAAETGYSPATVSNVLNKKGNVGAKATGIILEALKTMGYRRASQIDRVIFAVVRMTGRIVDDSPFHAVVYAGVERAARELSLKASMVTLDLTDPATRKAAIAELADNPNAGVALLATEIVDDDDYALFEDFPLPLVMVDGWSDRLPFDCVGTANESAAYRATAYLALMGHERMGYVGSSVRIKNFPLRERGFRRVLDDMRIPFDEHNRLLVDPSPEPAFAQISTWLDGDPELPTAFFCDNDIIAASLVRALQLHGYAVPEGVSVMGFDDEQLCQLVQPPLSTVHVPRHKMGAMAVHRLMEQTTAADAAPCIALLHTSLVHRQSVQRI